MKPEIIWAALRSTRSETPSAASKGARRKTYTAALEQTEQMFTAAASVGVATQPLLIFYGLSQGGRAIAAAASNVKNSDYPLSGHGMKSDPSTWTGALANVTVFGDGSSAGSFTRLSAILKSPVCDKSAPTEVGELWGSLPEGSPWALNKSALPPLTAAFDDMRAYGKANEPVGLIVTGVPKELVKDPLKGPTPELRAHLDRYPQLAGYTDIDVRGVWPDQKGGTVGLSYPSTFGFSDYWERHADAWIHRTDYGFHGNYVFPAVGSNSEALHPLMAWWSVLYALSMLARYHPEVWADHTAVDRSKVAVPIEQLLAQAQIIVPELILHTITQVSK